MRPRLPGTWPLAMEVAALQGHTSVLVLWDGETFYDLLYGHATADSALRQGFPVVSLAFGMMGHRLPRVLTCAGELGPVTPSTGRSLVAGCSSSTSLARARINQATGEARPTADTTIHQHVDGVSPLSVGPERHQVQASAIAVGLRLARA